MNNLKRLALTIGVGSLLVSAILFGVWFYRLKGPGHLVWDAPVVKKTIQTFAYKVYGKPSLEDGRYFLSKIVFHNTGSKPVTDFSISYQVQGYIDWTSPETLPQIPVGQTVVKCFYPQFPMKVTEIKNTTPSALEARIHWNDGTGKAHDEVVHEDFQFRGVNEFETTDLPANEVIGWHDGLRNSNLEAAMVTPNDPVVTEYAAAITGTIGGALGGAGNDNDKIEIMRATYNYMVATGMRYAGAEYDQQQIGDTVTGVQTIRLPRDVILSNNGLCVELTLVWASVLEHLGVDSIVFLRPGHAFIVVPLASTLNGIRYFPIECTAITPKAVEEKGLVSFERAYKMAYDDYIKYRKNGQFIAIRPSYLHTQGIQPPELPGVNIEDVKRIIASRRALLIRRY